MVKLEARQNNKLVTLEFKGQLRTEDYARFAPELDRLVAQHGKLRLLLDISEMESIEPQVLLRDLVFDARHYSVFERIAMVGDARWHEWLTKLGQPFTGAELRYFDCAELAAAERWLAEGSVAVASPVHKPTEE